MPFVSTPFAVLADSGVEESVTDSGPEARVRFKVAWGDRYGFVREVCGGATGGPGGIVRSVPLAYPPSPNLYAMPDARITPYPKIKAEGDWVAYDWCVVEVRFAVPEFSFDTSIFDPVPWTTTTFEVGGEFLTLPETAYKFAGGVAVGAPVGRVIPQVAISFKRHWVPYLPVAEVFNLVGRVNQSAFHIGAFACPPETLLFLGGPNQRDADSGGNRVQTVEYKMTYRPIPWNKFLHPDGASGFQYLVDNSGNRVYQQGDFSTLP